MANRFRPGQHKVICDRTGFAIYSSEARKEWTGHIVRRESFESRHPQDFVRGIPDHPGVTDARPPGTDRFLADNEVTPDSL